MKRQRTEPNTESEGNGAALDAASDAHAMPSLDAITATLSVILRTLEKVQAQVTNINETQLSLVSAQRHLSNQVLDLQNHKKKFFAGLQDLPLEVIIQIFAWIPVRSVFKYRRLSRMINECLLTSQFAVLNMQLSGLKKRSKRGIGGLWLVLPQSYQTAVARALSPHVKTFFAGIYKQVEYKHVVKSLPSSICCLTSVEEIIIENYTLTGDIPDVFGALKNLTILRLRSNSLTGALPSSLNLLSALQHLDLANNQLIGDFPALPNLNHLVTLSIGHNYFTGPVPTVFGNPLKLEFLHADHNLFSVLPASICQFTNLLVLHISKNAFSCEIPSGIWNLTAVICLEMSGCNMSGSLTGMGNLGNLQTLDASNNLFSGELPSREILNFQDLEALHLVGNRFSGGEILDMSQRDVKMTMCLDRDYQRTYVVREGFHKCYEEHGVIPYTGDFSGSESEDSEDE